MQRQNRIRLLSLLTTASLLFLLAPRPAAAQSIKILHSFSNNGTDAKLPDGGLIFDSAHNLYGTTIEGGINDDGTVYELVADANGGWTEKTLYKFANNNQDGTNPTGSLVFDRSGNLYGITVAGGTHDEGAVYELMPDSSGGWTEKVIFSFRSAPDGNLPAAGLIFDSKGNLYGTTELGGPDDDGTVFELTPLASGTWVEKQIFTFHGTDGYRPFASLIFDSTGNLYGTTLEGGDFNSGTVFELSPSSDGTWTENTLYSFGVSSTDGTFPAASLIFDSDGNLYSTTAAGGGGNGGGTVFELSPSGDGWTESILYNFPFLSTTDGYDPVGSVIFDSSGNLYGTTSQGGSGACTFFAVVGGCGTVFRLSPSANGVWVESILSSFNFDVTDDFAPGPPAGLIHDNSKRLFGTTYGLGTHNSGTVFEFRP